MKKIYVVASLALTMSSAFGQIITTVCGNGTGAYAGDGAQATAAELYAPYGVTFDAAGNLYIADYNNHRIRKVTTAGMISTVAGDGTRGYNGDGIPATAAELNYPYGVACDAAGNLYIADNSNHRIRKVNTAGIISTIAGMGSCCFSGDGGAATAARLNLPIGVALDATGNLYIADDGNNRIRKVNTVGIISTFAGMGTAAYTGDGGQATNADIGVPIGVVLDAVGNVYISDNSNSVIRKVNTAGIISTFAGIGTGSFSGDGAAATAAALWNPSGVALDAAGNLYIVDESNQRIRKVSTAGIISTIVGNGTLGFSGDGGAATAAELYNPIGVVCDASGNLYISDRDNNRIRIVTNPNGTGIQQVTSSNEVSIYPNPAKESLTLTLSKGEGKTTIYMYDMIGKLVMQRTYSPPSEGQGEAIDVSDLAEGIYNISISSNEGVVNKRVVIVK